jgi:hypothetical protein
MTSIKLGDMVKPFDGSGNIVTWLEKVKLVCTMQKIGDLATVIPLFLEDAAFAVYLQMDAAKKTDAEEVEATLLAAFAMDCFQAYEAFRQRQWQHNEPVDVYLADLKRLAGLANISTDEVLRCAFVTGLPTAVSSQLRSAARIKKSTLPELLEQARVLVSEQTSATVVAAATGRQRQGQARLHHEAVLPVAIGERQGQVRPSPINRRCFVCNEVGHIARMCPRRHRAAEAQLQSGNASGKPYAPAASHDQC